ncbi:hypothetical protein GS511_08620 [Leptospira borgpetersenii]|nr:hypothetical protein LEP1GSC121_3777 [Leptospira borgpetersenii serovar Castellonis str. 200801910]EMO11654.1 hypothetical protein LEP1GSC137_3325 [Leptospira borgpetersenii str. Noumea 25]KGE22576.1 hypothetical protein IQ66_15730 [Leptospira borgpetersenii serovar Ballum]QHE27044.1 hypothetical protein GS524_08615 [Leptospira borgpetersenii]OOV44952.1 hypothetical protein B1H38_06825 [Leptospira borgpetersenii serovar Ballum]
MEKRNWRARKNWGWVEVRRFSCQLDLSDKAKNSSRFAPRVLGHAVDQWLPKFGVFVSGNYDLGRITKMRRRIDQNKSFLEYLRGF